MALVSQLAPGQVPVAASGIAGPDDIGNYLAAGIFNFLVGESIVRSDDPVRFIRNLMGPASDVRSLGHGSR
jgi:indole-3-glycerol phosphate synthase